MDKRSSHRTSLTLDYSSQLLQEGQTYAGAQVTNISPDGCCIRLPAASAQHLKDDELVDGLLLSRLTSGPFGVKARIAWHSEPEGGKWVKAGMEFLETPKDCAEEIRDRVAEGLAYWEP
jgi:hypothetical protein